MKHLIVLAAVILVFASCSTGNDRFESGPDLAKALREEGFPCEYVSAEEDHMGVATRIPEGESRGRCDGVAIYVFSEDDALEQLNEGEAASIDDTPRIYWVYGENWFVAADRATRDRIHDALGEQVTDNTKL